MKKLILFLLFNFSLMANVKVISSQIDFMAEGKPAFVKANGSVLLKNTNLVIKDKIISGKIEIDLNSLNSGIELRDEHLKNKYLMTTQYPIATLTLKNKQMLSFNDEEQVIKGHLNFHGKSRDVNIVTKFKNQGSQFISNGKFELKLSDFGVDLPSFQGITAADKVTIKTKLLLEI